MLTPLELIVLADRCIACGACHRLAPHLFVIEGHRRAVPAAARVEGRAAAAGAGAGGGAGLRGAGRDA
ncbi:MAG: 4Fe-4S domain-containing protein [Bacillota bacterium]